MNAVTRSAPAFRGQQRASEGFSPEWEERYRANTHLSIWPWSDLVSYVMRYARPSSSDCHVLELGCGAGANIPFFQHLRVHYHAIEGSTSIVRQLQERFPKFKRRIVAGDFTHHIPFDVKFDLIVDRGSLTHNSTAAINRCLRLVREVLKPGGKLIGIDWFSTTHSEFARGVPGEDRFSRGGYARGPFAGVGTVHFSNRKHLERLFRRFELEVLELKTVSRKVPRDGFKLSVWNLVARKT